MMKLKPDYKLPPEKQRDLQRVIRLEWWNLGFRLSIIIAMFLALGGSQAMKTAWIEDMVSLVPPIAFLIAMRFRNHSPNNEYPYGYQRVTVIAFLCAAVALSVMGFYLLFESMVALVKMEHPSIGGITLFGETFWLGWLMIVALIYSVVPPVILGHMQQPAAEKVHEKTVYADAKMSKADWMTGLAAIVGVIGIGMGFWWADATAAGLISLSVIKDGVTNLKEAVGDLINRRPRYTAEPRAEEIGDRLRERLCALSWVSDAAVRLREEGHVFLGEAFVVPTDDTDLTARLNAASDELYDCDWRIHQVVVTAVPSIENE